MIVRDEAVMHQLGVTLGQNLKGGEVIELIGDVGAGKTTLVKGIADGLGITDDVQSPSFTINRNYQSSGGLTLCHYDFYRLNDAGIMSMEIAEAVSDPQNITIIEWAESVHGALPPSRITININYLPESGRDISILIPDSLDYLGDIIK